MKTKFSFGWRHQLLLDIHADYDGYDEEQDDDNDDDVDGDDDYDDYVMMFNTI